MQNIFTNIKCSEIILSNANENWYIILYDLFSRLCYIATCGPFCKDATHIGDKYNTLFNKYTADSYSNTVQFEMSLISFTCTDTYIMLHICLLEMFFISLICTYIIIRPSFVFFFVHILIFLLYCNQYVMSFVMIAILLIYTANYC